MYHFQKTYCYMMNTMKGYNLDYEKWSGWDWPETEGGVTNNDRLWIWSAGVKLGLFRYGHLYRGTIEGVRSLSKLGDVVVITHRPETAVQDTLDWLSYLRLPFKEVHLLTQGQAKSQVKCDLYVDDKPENCIDFAENTDGTPLLWLRPWNGEWVEGYSGDQPLHMWAPDTNQKIMAIQSWGEVVNYARDFLAKG